MSGRRRRDDGWDDGRLDAQEDRGDPWSDDGVGDWGIQDADPVDETDRSRKSSGGAAGAYVRNAPPNGQAFAAPDFPSFQATGGSSNGDRYGSTSGYGSQRGSANGYGTGGYNGDGYRDAAYDPNAGYGSSRDGYQGAGYGRTGSGSNGAARRDAAGYDSGYGSGSGYGGANGRSGSTGYTPEFMPVDGDEPDDDGAASTPRPYGRLSIYTLHEDKTREFDRLAERAAEGVRTAEPDTLVYVIHVVPKAPQQRIIYEIYRDRAAFMSHERQPHIRQFAADRASCVLATNIIDLRLKYAKVAALGSPSESAAPGQPKASSQPSWSPRSAEPVQGGGDRYAAGAQYSPTQYSPTQYSPAPQYSPPQPQAAPAVASFTPAADQYGTDNSQYPTVGREAYSPAPQYGNPGNGAYGTNSGQYGAANSNGYSGTPGYANGGSYPSSGYPSSNGHQSASGYSGDNGYSGSNGYQGTNGYSGSNGYANGSGYQGSNGYPSGTNGYGGGYPNGTANGSGSGYGASGGYTDSGSGSYSASASTQYAPRYRELTSGTPSDPGADGYQGNGSRYGDDGRQSEWDPRSQGYR
jgi:quinol monooxygenase YgiN